MIEAGAFSTWASAKCHFRLQCQHGRQRKERLSVYCRYYKLNPAICGPWVSRPFTSHCRCVQAPVWKTVSACYSVSWRLLRTGQSTPPARGRNVHKIMKYSVSHGFIDIDQNESFLFYSHEYVTRTRTLQPQQHYFGRCL